MKTYNKKKKWYQGFVLYSLVFFIAIYNYASYIFVNLFSTPPVNYTLFKIIFCFILGFCLFLIKKKVPFLELIIFFIADVVLVSNFYLEIILIFYIDSILGVFVGYIVYRVLTKNYINRCLMLNFIKFIRNKNFCNKNSSIPIYLLCIYLFILFFIYFIIKINPSYFIQTALYIPSLFVAGAILSYITQKIPILSFLISMIIFYIPIKAFIVFELYIGALYYFAIMYLCLLIGGFIGFGFYKKTLKFFKFKKMTIKFLSLPKGAKNTNG